MKRILSLIITLSLALTLMLGLTSCGVEYEEVGTGACEYYTTRDTTGRDIKYVIMSVRDFGSIILLLDATNAPVTVENFVKLAEDGFYNGLTFHRVMYNFMIQGGDPEANGSGGSDEEIFGEFDDNGHKNDISHKRGVISMARSQLYNSASSQFFICNADSEYSLDGKYAAFGYVIAGMSVVDSITQVTIQYANPYNNYTIANKSNQAVISRVDVISGKKALEYVNGAEE